MDEEDIEIPEWVEKLYELIHSSKSKKSSDKSETNNTLEKYN